MKTTCTFMVSEKWFVYVSIFGTKTINNLRFIFFFNLKLWIYVNLIYVQILIWILMCGFQVRIGGSDMPTEFFWTMMDHKFQLNGSDGYITKRICPLTKTPTGQSINGCFPIRRTWAAPKNATFHTQLSDLKLKPGNPRITKPKLN